MKLIDKYIFKKIIPMFFSLSAITLMIIIIFDYILFKSSFYDLKFVDIIYLSFLRKIPILKIILPISIFISIALTVRRFSKNNEIIAILSTGNSFYRFLQPFILFSIFMIKIFLIIEFFLVPISYKLIDDFKKNHKMTNFFHKKHSNFYIKLSKTKYLSVVNYDFRKDEGFDIIIDEIVDCKLVSRISAQKMKWDKNKNKWTLINWTKRVFKKKTDDISQGSKIFLTGINIKPDFFWFNVDLMKKLTTPNLTKYIKILQKQFSPYINDFKLEQSRRIKNIFLFFFAIFMAIFLFINTNTNRSNRRKILDFVICIISFVMLFSSKFNITINNDIMLSTFITIFTSFIYLFYLYKKTVKNISKN